MQSRTITALAGVAISLLVSVVAWYQFDTLLFFLVVPFVPLLLPGRGDDSSETKTCPDCGFRTRDPDVAYCPRDGEQLEGG